MQTFCEFIDRKGREAKRHLRIVQKLLETSGLKVRSHLDDDNDDEPYVFLYNPSKKISFDGIRIYKIGNQMAYRVQKEEKTHPYGKAYQLDLEDMFDDFLSDHMEEEHAGKLVIKSVVEELHKFFVKTSSAEQDLMQGEFGANDPLGRVVVNSQKGDYANLIHNKA